MLDLGYVLTVCITLHNIVNITLQHVSFKIICEASLKIHRRASEIPALHSSLDSYIGLVMLEVSSHSFILVYLIWHVKVSVFISYIKIKCIHTL